MWSHSGVQLVLCAEKRQRCKLPTLPQPPAHCVHLQLCPPPPPHTHTQADGKTYISVSTEAARRRKSMSYILQSILHQIKSDSVKVTEQMSAARLKRVVECLNVCFCFMFASVRCTWTCMKSLKRLKSNCQFTCLVSAFAICFLEKHVVLSSSQINRKQSGTAAICQQDHFVFPLNAIVSLIYKLLILSLQSRA